jgi:DNA-binding NarL/FixJ family response regulator
MKGLSTQERVVLRYMASGMTAKQISQKMELSEHTVKSYAKSTRAKMGASSICAVVLKAERAGLLVGVEV